MPHPPGLIAWLATREQPTLQDYRRRMQAALAQQDSHRITQRALVASVEVLLHDARTWLADDGRVAAFEPADHEAFRQLLGSLVSEVLSHNRHSCALSNFDEEHRPSREYTQDMLRDINAAYRAFLRDAGLDPEQDARHAAPSTKEPT